MENQIYLRYCYLIHDLNLMETWAHIITVKPLV